MNKIEESGRVVLLTAGLWALAMLAGRTTLAADPSAPDSFGQPVASDELGVQRGGKNDTTNSFNTTATLDSQQSLTAVNSGNSISAGGDVTSGSVTIAADALSNTSGMTNVVINSAPQSNVQGGMTLNLILQQGAPRP
jgi:hypothetical protein